MIYSPDNKNLLCVMFETYNPLSKKTISSATLELVNVYQLRELAIAIDCKHSEKIAKYRCRQHDLIN